MGLLRLVWVMALVTACGNDAGTSSTSSGASGGVSAGGSAGVSGGGARSVGGMSSNGGTANAGSANAGSGGALAVPPNAVKLGPYSLSGHRSSGPTDFEYDLELGAHGYAVFTALGSLQVGQSLKLANGLIHAPTGAPIDAGWVCPGPNATWVPTRTDDTPDCNKSPCSYTMLMPSPSELACPAVATANTLEFSPVPLDGTVTATATSSVSRLNGAGFYVSNVTGISIETPPTGNPIQISYFEAAGGPTEQLVEILFDSEPVTPAPGAFVTEWALQNISVIYSPSGFMGPTELLCATGGTYRISSTMPLQHAISLTGVSAPLTCPGTPLATPLTLEIDD